MCRALKTPKEVGADSPREVSVSPDPPHWPRPLPEPLFPSFQEPRWVGVPSSPTCPLPAVGVAAPRAASRRLLSPCGLVYALETELTQGLISEQTVHRSVPGARTLRELPPLLPTQHLHRGVSAALDLLLTPAPLPGSPAQTSKTAGQSWHPLHLACHRPVPLLSPRSGPLEQLPGSPGSSSLSFLPPVPRPQPGPRRAWPRHTRKKPSLARLPFGPPARPGAVCTT